MKRIKVLIVAVLLFSLTFSLTSCAKSPTGNTDEVSALLNDTTVQQNQNVTVQSNTLETVILSQPVSTVPASVSATAQNTAPSTQNTDTSGNTNTTTATRKPTQAQQSQNNNPTSAPQQDNGVISAVNKYSADYNGITHTVFYPQNAEKGNVKYPVIVFANGTGFSYTIYESLLKELAMGGYIVVANNVTMAGDGTAQISSLDFIISENKNSSSVLYGNIITDKIAAAGHSQGGRSAVNAAAADSRFDCVISLAGSNYTEEAEKLNTPALFLAGTKDMIVDADRWVKPAYDVCKGPAVYASLIDGIHTSCCTSPGTYTSYIFKWCGYRLKNESSAKSTFTNGGALSKDSAWTDFSCKGL